MSDIFKKLKGISFGPAETLETLQEEADELLSELEDVFRFECIETNDDLEQLRVDLKHAELEVKKFFGIDEKEEKKITSSSTWVSSRWITDWAESLVGCMSVPAIRFQIRAMLEEILVAYEK